MPKKPKRDASRLNRDKLGAPFSAARVEAENESAHLARILRYADQLLGKVSIAEKSARPKINHDR